MQEGKRKSTGKISGQREDMQRRQRTEEDTKDRVRCKPLQQPLMGASE